MAGADRFDRAQPPKSKQERRPFFAPIGDVAAGISEAVATDPPLAVVVFAERSGDGQGPDRGAHYASLCRHRPDQ